MAFDYNSRTKWEKARLERWNKEHEKQIGKLSAAKKELFDEVRYFSSYQYCGFPVIRKWTREKLGAGGDRTTQSLKTLKELILSECADLIEIFVPAEYRADYEYLLDQYVNYQYSRSLFRPTVRTKDPAAHTLDAFGLMQAYKVLGIYGVTPLEYLTERTAEGVSLDEEFLDFKRNDTYTRDLHMVQFDDILAARIDNGDSKVIEGCKEAILSDTNTVIVTVPLIRGIVKSKNTELHDLLAKFLVAARLQEGVRQAVCENADCGRPEAFLTILGAIEENDLIRFSGVKRAVATWTGICSVDSMDRVSNKLLAGVGEAVRDRARAFEMTQTDDSVQIVTGLWALGFYEAQDAVGRMLQIVESGTKNQRLTISYYNRYMQHSDYSEQAARKILETYPDDQQMAAAFMPTYLDAVDTIVRGCIRNSKNQSVYMADEADVHYDPLPVKEIFDNEEQARLHSMKKRKIEYSPMIFPWYGAELDKSDLTQRLAVIAYALQDDALIDETCVRLTDIMDSYYNTRSYYLRVLLHAPRTQAQRDALIGYVAEKESYTRKAAYQILKKLQADPDPSMHLTQDEYRQLEGYLRLKNEESRRFIIEILEEQDKEGVYASIRRLLGGEEPDEGKKETAAKGKKKAPSAADREQMRLAGLDMLKRRSEESDAAKKECAALLREVIPDAAVLSDKEKVLYEEIAGSEGSGSILNTEGYGLYDPKATYEPELKVKGAAGAKASSGLMKGIQILKNSLGMSDTKKLLKDYFSLSAKEMDQYFDKIKAFIVAHGKLEYTSVNGDKQLLENGLYLINYNSLDAIETRYPFSELWIEVYETIIKDPKVLFNLYFAVRGGYDETDVKDIAAYLKAEKTIFGEAYSGYHYADPKYMGGRHAHSTYQTILDMRTAPTRRSWTSSRASSIWSCPLRSRRRRSLRRQSCPRRSAGWREPRQNMSPITLSGRSASYVDRVYQFDAHEPNTTYGRSSSNILSILSYVKAHELGMITKDFLYKAAFELVGLKYAVGDLGSLFLSNVTIYALRQLQFYMPVDMEKKTLDTQNSFYKLGKEIYENIVNLILDVELKRGDTPTVFSDAVSRISRIEGIPRLMEILRAMGSDPLDRNTYYSYNGGTSKKESLSHLLKVCWPADSETAADLKTAVKKNKVSTDRLIEGRDVRAPVAGPGRRSAGDRRL